MDVFAAWLLVVAAGTVLVIALLFVFHPHYELGVLGVTGLALIALAAVSRMDGLLERIFDGEPLYISPRSLLVWIGVALFFGQLAWRFLRRCKARNDAVWRSTGKHPSGAQT